jgi:hypothetical protein
MEHDSSEEVLTCNFNGRQRRGEKFIIVQGHIIFDRDNDKSRE